MEILLTKTDRATAFVKYIIGRCESDKGVAAALRRADNPATEYQSWEFLAAFNIALDKPYERLPFATVAAAVAKAKISSDGEVGIGQAIASCYDDSNDSDQAKAKLRRLLACDSVEEVCRILRSLFSLIESRGKLSINYSDLLKDLLKFYWDSQQVKSRWAQDFYRTNRKSPQEQGGTA